jgi:rhodanese-related sulfurtransferase
MHDVKRISPQEAHAEMARGYTYVDVRSELEFEEGHPETAVNVPISHMTGGGMTPNPDFVAVMEKAFGKDAKVILGCKTGGRSMRAAQALLAAGFTNVLEQRAGWDGARDAFGQVSEPGWSRTGLPMETGETADRSYAAIKAQAGA